MKTFTKPVSPKGGQPIKASDMANHARAIEELQRASIAEIKPSTKTNRNAKSPLWVTLFQVGSDYKVWVKYGHVVPRHNASGEAGTPVDITSLPTPSSPLTVVEDEKLWVELSIDEYGKVTSAAWNTGSSWPTDAPPSLIGGSDQTGAAGTRNVRIAEIIANPEGTTTPAQLIVDQLHTGHVDHFQPELCENTIYSPSSGDARVLKVWNASAGRWDFRYLTQGDGVIVTENADSIEVKADPDYSFPSSHPWKVTDAGGGNAAIAAGFVLGYYFTLSTASPGAAPATQQNFSPDTVVVGNGGTYAGGSLAISGTKYIYAEIPKNITGSTNEYAETSFIEDTDNIGATGVETIELFDEISPTLTDTATLVASASAPDAYTPTTNKAAVCIAKVTNAAGEITVDAQYLTHNPIIFIPVVGGIWEYP